MLLLHPNDPPRVLVLHDEDLTYNTLYEVYDTAWGGHLGRERNYGVLAHRF